MCFVELALCFVELALCFVELPLSSVELPMCSVELPMCFVQPLVVVPLDNDGIKLIYILRILTVYTR